MSNVTKTNASSCPIARIGDEIVASCAELATHDEAFASCEDPEHHAQEGQAMLDHRVKMMADAVRIPARSPRGFQVQAAIAEEWIRNLQACRGNDPSVMELASDVMRAINAMSSFVTGQHNEPIYDLGIEAYHAIEFEWE